MNTESRRKASADFHAKRKADGWKKSTHWLSPEGQAALEVLKSLRGLSADSAVNEALKEAADRVERPAGAPKPVAKRAAKPKADSQKSLSIESLVAPALKRPTDPRIVVVDPKPKTERAPKFQSRLKGEWKPR
jgi:hypothetical protein